MEWTEEDKNGLLAFKKSIDCDDIKVKEQIKKMLLNNKYIIRVLNNKELEESDAEVDEYYGTSILPYYMVTPTQTSSQNYLCYEVSYNELARYNDLVKTLQIIFHIVCEQKNIIDKDTYVARHDLLAALVQDQFNYMVIGGGRLQLVSDIPNSTDTNYATRTLTFEQTTDNNLVKSRLGKPWIINKEV